MDMERRTAGNRNRSWMVIMNQSATFRKVTVIPTILLSGLRCLEHVFENLCLLLLSLLSPLCVVFIIIYLKQIMFLGYIVLHYYYYY